MTRVFCFFLLTSLCFSQRHNQQTSVAPLAGISILRANGENISGPQLGVQMLARESNGQRWGFSAGFLFHSTNNGYAQVDPYVYNQSGAQSYPQQQFGPRISNGVVRQSSLHWSGAFVGADWIIYLADGQLRPYAGLSLYGVLFSFNAPIAGTIAPAVRAGLETNIGNQFTGFAEVQHLVGTPTLFGNRAAVLDGITSFNVGFSFAPRLFN
jgi:hypothetical protein